METNDVDTKYFVGGFNNREFPLRVNECLPYTVVAGFYSQIAQCLDESNVEYSIYSDDTCTDPVSVLYFNTSDQNGLGTFGDFNCDKDAMDAYTTVQLSIGEFIKQSIYEFCCWNLCIRHFIGRLE